jgi:hypothetical protein
MMRARRFFAPLPLALAVAACAALSSPAMAQAWKAIPANPNIEVVYLPPQTPMLRISPTVTVPSADIYNALKNRQVLEELQHFFAPLHLPHHLRLQMGQCNVLNAWYSPSERSLTLCYEIAAWLVHIAPPAGSLVDGLISRPAVIFGGFTGVALHESGHMMFDMLKVPVFGREEDAADETAAFLALQFNKDVARAIIKGFAYADYMLGKDPDASAAMSAWSDVHGKPSQRLYNTLCLGYGADPATFQDLIDRGWLPKQRAKQCGQEYAQLRFAFVKTIYPFIDRDLMLRVQKTQWLTPEELK